MSFTGHAEFPMVMSVSEKMINNKMADLLD